MANARVYLYGSQGLISRIGGVLAGSSAAIFSPWPSSLTFKTPFALRVVAPDGSADLWALPQEVEIPRLRGGHDRDGVATVRLQQPMLLPIDHSPEVSESALTTAIESRTPRDALIGLGPEQFGGLAVRSRTLPEPLDRDHDRRPPMVDLPERFTVINGSPNSVALSICRIFRWD